MHRDMLWRWCGNMRWHAIALVRYFSYFAQKTGFDISYKLSSLETIFTKYQNWFSGKSKKNIINLSPAEFAQRVVNSKD